MAASIINDWQSCKSVLQCNNYMWNNQVACDVNFLVGKEEERISAHKYVLVSRSCVFYSMFCGPLAETRQDIALPDIEPPVFKALLHYLYSETTNIEADIVLPLLYAAKKYSIQALARQCVQYLELDQTTENICAILEQSHLYDEKDLQKKCLSYICAHAREVLQSSDFLELSKRCLEIILSCDELQVDEKTVLTGVLKWASHQCEIKGLEAVAENQRQVLGDLLYMVRFPLLGDQYFTEVVADMDILSDSEKVELFKYFFKKKTKCASLLPRIATQVVTTL